MEDLITWDPLVISPTPGVTLEDGFDEETGGESFESIVNVENYEETEVKIEINDYVEDESNVDNCDDAEVKIEIDDNVEEEEEYDESSELPNDEVEEQVNLENFEEAEVKIEINDDLEDLVNVENCEDVEVKKEPNTDVEKKVEVTDANHFQDAESKDSCKVKPGKKRRTSTNERSVSKYHDLYFKEGEEFLCDACNAHYKSLHGVQNHLKVTVCGFGQKEGIQKKVQHSNHYTRVNDRVVCDICLKEYNSLRGVHHHLANTACGKEERPEKPKTEPVEKTVRKDYTNLYSLNEESKYACNTCQSLFKSHHGIRCHLNQKVCGFGKEEVKTYVNRKWFSSYHMDGDNFVCSTCLRVFKHRQGIYRHLKRSAAGCFKENPVSATENVDNKPAVEIEVKPDLSLTPSSNTILDIDLD